MYYIHISYCFFEPTINWQPFHTLNFQKHQKPSDQGRFLPRRSQYAGAQRSNGEDPVLEQCAIEKDYFIIQWWLIIIVELFYHPKNRCDLKNIYVHSLQKTHRFAKEFKKFLFASPKSDNRCFHSYRQALPWHLASARGKMNKITLNKNR